MRTRVQFDEAIQYIRGAERVTLSAEVGIRRAGIRSFRVHVFDASRQGCRIEFVERPAVGERVWVKFDGLDSVEAWVRWVEGHVGGVQFEHPLHEAIFERLRGSGTPERT
jgi:hypothetical protein